MELPPRPVYDECPDKPDVQGRIVNKSVIIDLNAALELKNWIGANEICHESNLAKADGHIEKLENRLKALGE